jgi:hypothetical protein
MPDPFPRKKLADFTLEVGDNASRAALIVDSDSLVDEDVSSPSLKNPDRNSYTSPGAFSSAGSDLSIPEETQSDVQAHIKRSVDGMTLCLLHLHAANTRLQARFALVLHQGIKC